MVLSIVGVVLVLSLIGYFIFSAFPGQTIVPSNTYTCPDNKYCSVTPILFCTSPQTQQNVVFRASEQASFPNQLAVDYDDDGDLDAWIKTSSSTSQGICTARPKIQDGFLNSWIVFYNSNLYVCTGIDNQKYTQTGASISTQSTPLEPYSSTGREIYSGDQSLYQCSQTLKVNGNTVGTLSHSSNSPTPSSGKFGNAVQLTENQVFNAQGTGTINLDVETSDIPVTTCVVQIEGNDVELDQGESVCLDIHTKASCDVPPQVSIEDKEDQICVNGQWEDLYTINLVLSSSTVALGESFDVSFELDDPQYSDGGRQVYLYLKENGQTVKSDQAITSSSGSAQLSLTPDDAGYYELEVSMAHPESDFSRTYSVQVTSSLSVSTFRTQSPQYDNQAIVAKVEVSRGGSPVAVFPNGDIIVEAAYNDNPRSFSRRTAVEVGEYNIIWDNLVGDGNLRFRVKVEDPSSSYITPWTQWRTIEVKRAGLLFTNIDFPDSECNNREHTGKFTIVDSLGNRVNGATVSVLINGMEEQVKSEGSGVYSFSHFYDQGGNYNVEISASSDGIVGQESYPLNILSCSSGGGGTGGGGIDWTFYIIIGVFVLGIIVFVYFVFFFRRKRK